LASGKWVVDFNSKEAVIAKFAGIRVGKCFINKAIKLTLGSFNRSGWVTIKNNNINSKKEIRST